MNSIFPYRALALISRLVIVLCLVGLLGSCGNSERSRPTLRETYLDRDNIPFGSSAFKNLSPNLFEGKSIKETKKSFEEEFPYIEESKKNDVFISLTKELFLNESEAQRIVDFVKSGNQAYFFSNNIDQNLLGLVDMTQFSNEYVLEGDWDTAYYSAVTLSTDTTKKYRLVSEGFQNYFKKIEAKNYKVLGSNENGLANYVVVFLGQGKLFLHCDAKAFSNYFIASRNNISYVEGVLANSYEAPGVVYYDQHYKTRSRRNGDDKEFSTLDEIMKSPPLKAAFLVGLFTILLFVLFGLKRRQRTVPIIPPNINTSVSYTETMGRLYFQNNDNKDLAEKIVVYFNEHIRQKYFINKSTLSREEYWELLSRKSGASKELIVTLNNQIESIAASNVVSDKELLRLNQLIQDFYQSNIKK